MTLHSTIIHALEYYSYKSADDVAYRVLDSQGNTKDAITYSQLAAKVQLYAQYLSYQLKPRQRVLLVYDTQIDFVVALFACFVARVVAVPVYPPNRLKHRVDVSQQRLLGIIKNATPSLIISDTAYTSMLQQQIVSHSLPVVTLEQMGDITTAVKFRCGTVDEDDIALLQYTSGSTGEPKGVVVKHRHIINNVMNIGRLKGADSVNASVNWVPLTHDMGLICGVLLPFYHGVCSDLISPQDFLRRPAVWLETLSRLPAAISGGPNFAYELCCQRVLEETIEQLDLSRWRVAFLGSEMNHIQSCNKFYRRFKKSGFAFESFDPCYGLAEATLYVSGSDLHQKPQANYFDAKMLQQGRAVVAEKNGVEQLNVGQCFPDHQLLIVDSKSRVPKAEAEIGEIWFRGPSVAAGYWDNKTATEHFFNAFTAGGEGPFLRTGDLGFVYEGKLFIYSRLKDNIIIRGKNYIPEDIEWAVSACDPRVRLGAIAAFSLLIDHTEKLIIMAETRIQDIDQQRTIEENIRDCVIKNFGIKPFDIVLVAPKQLPKTVNGKLRRSDCKAIYAEQREPMSPR